MQMTGTYSQLGDNSNNFIIITIKNTTWGESSEFKDTIFENNYFFFFFFQKQSRLK